MPKKGTTTKYKRRAGVNIGTLKKEGFAYDPPIPADQFGGDVKALRQFKVNYKPDGTGREKQWKGIHKNLETGNLYLADGERYRELTDTEYEYITKEIGESKQLGTVEKRIGKPFRERVKEKEEVIEPTVDAPKKKGKKKGVQPYKSVSDQEVKKALKLLEMINKVETEEEADEVEVDEMIIEGKYVYIDKFKRVYDPETNTLIGIFYDGTMAVRESKQELWDSLPLGIEESDEESELEEFDQPTDDEEEEEEEEEYDTEEEDPRRPMNSDDVANDPNIITWTYEPEAIALKYIPQQLGNLVDGPVEADPIFTDYENNGQPILGNEEAGEFYPTGADEDWVDRQEGDEEEKALYYTLAEDDVIFREDEETGEEDEIVGIRGMRGHRRVLIFAPSQVGLDYPLLYDWEDKTNLGNAYEYEIPEDDLGMLVESRYQKGFDWFTDSKQSLLDNERTRNKSIEQLEEDLKAINVPHYREFYKSVLEEKKKMREQVINEIAEEILGGEIEESLKTKILEDLRSSKSKKPTTDMGGGKGTVEPQKKMKMKKKKLTEAQLAALAAARERRRAKIAAEKAAK